MPKPGTSITITISAKDPAQVSIDLNGFQGVGCRAVAEALAQGSVDAGGSYEKPEVCLEEQHESGYEQA